MILKPTPEVPLVEQAHTGADPEILAGRVPMRSPRPLEAMGIWGQIS